MDPFLSLQFLLLVFISSGLAVDLYPYGGQLDDQLPRGDDLSVEVNLTIPIKFYGQVFHSIFVNTNGLLSFLTEIPKFYNEPLPLDYSVIAVLYSNVDSRGSGQVYYRESRDHQTLTRAATSVRALFPHLSTEFRPLSVLVVTWDQVGYYNAKSDKRNTFQAAISTDGDESFVEMIYPEDGIQWIRGESVVSVLPDARAQAGISSPGGRHLLLQGSGKERVYNLPRWTNGVTPGLYIFRVGNIEDIGLPESPQISAPQEEDGEEANSCAAGVSICHKNAECFDETGGFCCQCNEGFLGNGRNCLDLKSQQRMSGRLNLSINGVEGHQLMMQAYIVSQDGRTYTAVTEVPQAIGYDLQLVTCLGSFVGWLFAKPIGAAPNGFQLTGGILNHTVEMTFDTRHKITLKQRYLGLDLFEQIVMEAEVVGTLPSIAPGTQLTVPDFQEHFTRISPGLLRSSSKHIVEVERGERHEVEVDQTVEYTEYCGSTYQGLSSIRLKSARNYLNFEGGTHNILRLASTNKISQNADGQDPCVEGHVQCVANSSCLVEGDSFRCVCNQGFQSLSSQTSGCVDINECEDSSAICHPRALCVNEVGTYSCQCLPGYTGNGKHCDEVESPQLPNAVCNITGNFRTCRCNHGFREMADGSELGFRCDDIDECSEPGAHRCHPNSDCYNTPGGYTCHCRSGYTGDGLFCQEEEEPLREGDPCAAHACPDYSLCQEDRDGPVCVCASGYLGTPPSCIPESEICVADSDCGENGLCEYKRSLAEYTCSCRAGYQREGGSCLPPASEEGFVRTCLEGECWCPPGYVDNGELCVRAVTTTTSPPAPTSSRQLTCREKNDCNSNAQCIYVAPRRTYECQCNSGYEGDGYVCTEFEMSCVQSAICDPNAECKYDDNSSRYICVCTEGFQGDGTRCYPTEEQQDCYNCHSEASCVDGVCICPEGWLGDGYTCEKEIPGCELLGNCSPEADCLYDSSELGFRCTCRQGFKGDGYYCERIVTCHDTPELCSPDATCLYAGSDYECKCNEDFFGNGTMCKAINRQSEEFLLLNKGRSTIQLPFNPSGSNIGRPIIINGDQKAIGIAIDCIEGRVYWSDILNQKIKSSKYNGEDVQDFISSGVKSPEGLAVDWINRRLYWTDSGMDVIAFASLDNGGEITTIASKDLVNPRGIAVHPLRGKVFWSDWNRVNPVIEWADLDGSNRQTLRSKDSLKLPNSLALDWTTDEVCWADAGLKTIECYNFQSNIPRTVVQNCVYPFGLAITPDNYYWTDWFTGKVESAAKGSGVPSKGIPLPLGGDDKLYGLVAVTATCPR